MSDSAFNVDVDAPEVWEHDSHLSPIWEPLEYHDTQQGYISESRRFNTLPCGRRSGKTLLLKRKVVIKSLWGTEYDDARFALCAPVRDQAKRIFWGDLKRMIPRDLVTTTSETELFLRLHNGSEIWVIGLDRPERIEGSPWDGIGVTEFGNVKKEAWGENIYPALADRNGWADLEGVPEGRNHYYDIDNAAKADQAERGSESEWASWHWTSEEILPLYGREAVLEQARRDLDALTYAQEFQASFVSFKGRAYHSFTDDNITRIADRYNTEDDLIICFDFNIAPGVAVIAQEMRLPDELDEDGLPRIGTACIGEVHIERGSNTKKVCAQIIDNWGDHIGRVRCHGDATGGAGGSAAVEGSDWELIEENLGRHFGRRLVLDHPLANPRERVRLNSLNSRCCSNDGVRLLRVDGAKCQNLVKDFEGVSCADDGSLDKKKNVALSHLTDAIGYYVAECFPVDAGRRVKTTEMDFI